MVADEVFMALIWFNAQAKSAEYYYNASKIGQALPRPWINYKVMILNGFLKKYLPIVSGLVKILTLCFFLAMR